MNRPYDIDDIDDIEEMIELIRNYDVEHDDCRRSHCRECSFLEDCHDIARQREDSEWAELINYGGYDTEEEFWEQLLS